jgi:hypothetical protein
MSRVVRLAGMLLVCVFAVAGCSSLAALQGLASDVQSAGYQNVNVNQQVTNGRSVLTIAATRNQTLSETDAAEVAEIAWKKFPGDIDELQVVLNGDLAMDAGSDELVSRFGERPAGRAEESSGGGVNIAAVVVVLVFAAALTVFLVLLYRRVNRPSRRRGPYPAPLPRNPYE